MKHLIWKKVILLFSSALISGGLFATEANTPNIEIVLAVAQDGTAPFDNEDAAVDGAGGHTAGLDGANGNIEATLNGVVRTYDIIEYDIHWSVNDVDSSASNDNANGVATNVTITIDTGRPDVAWVNSDVGIPVRCKSYTLTDAGNGENTLLTCVLGDVAEGSVGTISPIAKVSAKLDNAGEPTLSNDDTIPVTATIVSDQSAPVVSNQVSTTISAAAKGDWIKNTAELIEGVDNTGANGVVLIYPIFFKPSGGTLRGTEPLDDSFTMQLFDHAWSIPDNAMLITPAIEATIGRNACGGYDGAGNLPYGDDGSTLPATANATNTTNSFSLACSDTTGASTYPIVQMDFSNYTSTSAPASNASGTANDGVVIASQVAFWMPQEDFDAKKSAGTHFWNTINKDATLDTTDADSATNLVPNTEFILVAANAGPQDEVTIANNSVAQLFESGGTTAGAVAHNDYRQFARIFNGPYQEAYWKHDSDGLERVALDTRYDTVGGLNPIMIGTGQDLLDYTTNSVGWNGLGEVARNQIITLNAKITATEDVGNKRDEPIHLCMQIDNTYMNIIDFPSSFKRTETKTTIRSPFYLSSYEASEKADAASISTGSPSDGLAHIIMGDASNLGSDDNPNSGDLPTHGGVGGDSSYNVSWVRVNPIFTPNYVVEVANGGVPTYPIPEHGVTCNDADADATGWVATTNTAGLAAFATGTDSDGNTIYGNITKIRVRMLEHHSWADDTSTGLPDDGSYNRDANAWIFEGTSYILNLQARVKEDISANPDGSRLRIHSARASGDWAATPANLACTHPERFTSDTPTNGWCSLPYDTANEVLAAGGTVQLDTQTFEQATDPDGTEDGFRNIAHSDFVSIVGAKVNLSKTNLAGPTNLLANDDLVTFKMEASIIGASVEHFANVFVEDRIDLNRNFEFISQTTPVDENGNPLSGFVSCTNSFGGTADSLRCDFTNGSYDSADPNTYRNAPFYATWNVTVRLVKAPGDTAIENTAKIEGALVVAGVPSETPLSLDANAFAYTGPKYKELFIRKDIPDMKGVCTNTIGAAELADNTLINGDCSVFSLNGQYIYKLNYENKGSADLSNLVIIDTLPFVDDDAEININGDGRTPASAFSGTSTFVSAVESSGATIECTSAGEVDRDPANDALVWGVCDETSTAFRATIPTLAVGEKQTIDLTIQTKGNIHNDIYTNSFGARTDTIPLVARSNDVSAMVQAVSIGSIIWNDANKDGLQTAGELGIAGATAKLLNSDGTEYDSDPSTEEIEPLTLTTGADGLIYFENLPEGDYKIEVTMPVGYIPTINQQTADNDDTDNDSNIASSTGLVHTSGTFTLSINGEPDVDVENSPIAGSDDADADTELTNAAADASGNMTVDFGFQPVTSIGSTVWHDTDNSGTQNGAEAGIENVIVRIYESDGVTEVLVGPDGILGTDDDAAGGVLTDANGNYVFNNLPEGDYVIAVTPPAATPMSSSGHAGDDQVDGDDNGIQANSGDLVKSPVITLSAGNEPLDTKETLQGGSQDIADANGDMTVDFGFVDPSTLVSIGSTVFLDTDNNGKQEGTEAGIAGVAITLYATDGRIVATTTTDTNGNYFFANLAAGDYVVGVTPPAATPMSSAGSGGDDQVDGDDNGIQVNSGDEILSPVITLTVGSEPLSENETLQGGTQDAIDANGDMTIDFGLVSTTPGSISGFVTEDTDDNGTGDKPIEGVTLTLVDANGNQVIGTDGKPIQTVTTDQNGAYSFTNILAGTGYRVVETDKTGFISVSDVDGDNDNTVASITVTSGNDTPNNNYVDKGVASVSGKVIDPQGKPIVGAKVKLVNPDGSDIMGTDGNLITEVTVNPITGAYSFENVPVGDFELIETNPENYTSMDEQTDQSGDPANSSNTDDVIPVTVIAGELDDGNDFIDVLDGTVAGTVYIDENGNGVQDPGEPGIENVKVTITDSQGQSYELITDQNGNYAKKVPAGNTIIDIDDITLPAGFTQTQGTDTTTVTVPPGGIANDVDGYQPPAESAQVEGIVYLDANGNGTQDANEPGISGVTVIVTDVNGATQTLTTDSNGHYGAYVPAGDTSIHIDENTLPGGVTQTEGSNDTIVTVPAGGIAADIDGYQPPADAGLVDGVIYQDTNGNGIQDLGEPAIPGVQVTVTDSQGHVQTVTTNENGYYAALVPAGDTTLDVVESTLPGGMTQTQGTDVTVVTVPAGGKATDIDGYKPSDNSGELKGIVYKDLNNNGVQDAGEPGISGVHVTVTDNEGNIHTLVTDANGEYRTTVPAGSTLVDIEQSDIGYGYVRTEGTDPTTVNVPAGGVGLDVDGFKPPKSGLVQIIKTAYGDDDVTKGHDSGAGCGTPRAKSEVVLIDQDKSKDMPVTYCFEVTNTGESYITDIQVTDETLGVSHDQLTLLNGPVPAALEPGASLLYYYEVIAIESLNNIASVTASPSDENGKVTASIVSSEGISTAKVALIIDPPSGVKTVTASGATGMEWQMVWINDSDAAAPGVTVFDEVPEGTSFEAMEAGVFVSASGVYCEARGTSTTTAAHDDNCYFEAPSANYPRGRVIWKGTISADTGKHSEDEAENEVVIRFVTVLDEPNKPNQEILNQGDSEWDFDNDGISDTEVQTQSPEESGAGETAFIPAVRTFSIPTLSEWMLLILALLLLLSGKYKNIKLKGRKF